ncbi:MAG: hypothetical protein LBU57_01465 [Dysgonamonadaceae bacterium]|jgi:lipopolysaccharide export system protein LptA|nr:hypothetical protein [Dysgonamonadaceae bacterium]
MGRGFRHKISGRRNESLTGLFCLFFLVFISWGLAQDTTRKGRTETKMIHIEHDDMMQFRKEINPDAYVLKGNVSIRHDSTYMYCDSAYVFDKTNSFEAFDNVRIEQGDTLFIYGDYLYYDGNISLAKLRYNVRMENKGVTLFTDSFNFDRIKNIGYFFEGGVIIDSLNELSSVYGQYSPDTKIANFRRDVKLNNPNFVLTSDTLEYNTLTKVATILGPSVIESDSGTIHSTRGWYNTNTEESMLYDRSLIVSRDKNKTITADSMSYNRLTGYGEAFRNMVINDTLNKIILTGNYGYFNDISDFAFAADSARFIEYSQGDSLFVHADTFRMRTIDEKFREIKAYYGVRIYRTDLQGVCDSMQFNTKDSLLYLYKEPILWNTNYQMNGDTIVLYFNDSTIEKVHVINYAFAIEKLDSTYYNQMKGRDLIAFFEGGEMTQVDVSGNAETIYYPVDKGAFVGRNKTESSFFSIRVKNRKPYRIKTWPASNGVTMPLPDLSPEDKFLKDFVDFDYLRPKDKDDIFVKKTRKAEDVTPVRKMRHLQ